MKQELDNSPEEFLRNIAEELTNISGECTEIKQAQLTAATTDDLKAHAERMESVLTDGVIPAVNRVKELIKNPPTYKISSEGISAAIVDGLSSAVKSELYKNVDKTIKEGITKTYAHAVSYLKTAVDDIRSNVKRMSNGHWWIVIPNWVKTTVSVSFGILLIASIGFGIGFFNEFSNNEKFRKMEWLYRYERVSYDQEGIRNMMLREEAMMVGTKAEQDSIKRLVIRMERKKHAERTHSYFRPSDSWTPENTSNSIW